MGFSFDSAYVLFSVLTTISPLPYDVLKYNIIHMIPNIPM